MTRPIEARVVADATAGSPAALDRLMADHLPLLYTIAFWAAVRRDDLDDIVRNTLARIAGIDRLPDPRLFRAWLLSIALDEIRTHGPADPGTESAESAVTELGLSGQLAEAVRATCWLEPADQLLLSLWWPLQTGHLTRADLHAALQRNPIDVDADFSRLAAKFESARLIVRGLTSAPRCPALSEITALGQWRGEPAMHWHRRFATHIAGCARCGVRMDDMLPADALPHQLPLVPMPDGYTAFILSSAPSQAVQRISGYGESFGRERRHRGRRSGTLARTARLARRPSIAVAVLLAGITGVAALYAATASSTSVGATSGSPVVAAHTPASASTVSASPSAKPLNTATPPTQLTHAPVVSTKRSTASSSTPPTPPQHDSGDSNAVRQVFDLINQARAQAGLPPYTVSAGLTASSAAHDRLMIAGCGLNHQCPNEPDIGPRGAGGENIGVGGTAVSLTQLMLGEKAPNDGHRQNILNKGFKHVGIAVYRDSHGTVWMTQDFSG